MKTLIICILIVLPIFFISCEKDANIKLPGDEPKLAVFGFISPEDSITNIIVKQTVPYFGDRRNSSDVGFVEDAQVIITNNGNEYNLPYNSQTNSYFLDSNILKIKPGEEYFLMVSASGLPTVNSSVVVAQNKNTSLEYIDFKRNMISNNIYFKVKWTDSEVEKNYYRLSGYCSQTYTYSAANRDTTVTEYHILDEENYLLYDDSDWNGLSKTSNDLKNWYSSDSMNVHLILLTTDYHYYQYHKSVRDFQNNDGNPFSEPVIVYSNIENGSGVFCSYRKYEIEVDLEFL